MNALLILIPVSLVLLGIAVWAFFWAVDRGQFDDLDTPALRILEDDRPASSVPDDAAGADEDGGDPDRPR
ncbi:MAG: cbb3-type cytochrome oxidase assembly protein CcoS [Xanthomonadales bacterium]|nr:cbb3-type cytochrome oxidase assembly protein CcoS [Xanthomonadales bacterium]